MSRWNSSPHPISDVRDWHSAGRLELRPDFQRRPVWSQDAKIMLLDTIIRDIPMPKILVHSIIRNDQTYRIVIDGQQRLTAILEMLDDKLVLESPPCPAEVGGRTFSELPPDQRAAILRYKIDFNEISETGESELREIYTRVNKYNVQLNRQEMRRADYPGHFLTVSENLALHEFFDEAKVFTPAIRRRMHDVEFVSELLCAMIGGAQEKKETLDSYYKSLAVWPEDSASETTHRFQDALAALAQMFPVGGRGLRGTRFRQKADFYGLFLSTDALLRGGGSVSARPLEILQQDLQFLEEEISPSSSVGLLSAYAVRCVSDANSAASRRWRQSFLTCFLRGTLAGEVPTSQCAALFAGIYFDISSSSAGLTECPGPSCEFCEREIVRQESVLAWNRDDKVFQYSNCLFIHNACLALADDNFATVVPDAEFSR